MADLLTKPQQLVPSVGQNASGARIQAGSAFIGIGDTVTIGRVLYNFGFPIVPADNLWVPAIENPDQFTVVLIRDIHIFIRETDPTPATETDFQRIGMAETPKLTAFELDTRRNHLIWNFPSYLDRIYNKSHPTRPRGRGSGG
jgi:hypothetical protein